LSPRWLTDPLAGTFFHDERVPYLNRHIAVIETPDFKQQALYWRQNTTSPWQPVPEIWLRGKLQEFGIDPDFWFRNRLRLICAAATFDVSSAKGFVEIQQEKVLNLFCGFKITPVRSRLISSCLFAD